MKKIIAMLGSLMIIAGVKAQKEPAIKKETTPSVKISGIDSMKNRTALPSKDLSSKSLVSKDSSTTKLPSKYSPVVKPDKINPVALPDKQSPVTKPTTQ